MTYIIGIDAGGTKTSGAVFTDDGKKRFECEYGMGNMVVNSEQAIHNIAKVISKCSDHLESADDIYVYIGAAGITAGDNKKRLYDYLKKLYPSYIYNIMSDGYLALYAGLKGEDGVMLVSGTGSIGFGKKGDTVHRIGGWGSLIGDEGSGYSIGMMAIRMIFDHYDDGTSPTAFDNAIMNKLGMDTVFDLLGYVYSVDKKDIAAIARTVKELAKNGDGNAISILKIAGKQLAAMLQGLCARLGFIDGFKVILRGSVATKIDIVYKEVESYIHDKYNDVQLVTSGNEVTVGAVYIHNRCKKEEVS